jgi:hypothetical protein
MPLTQSNAVIASNNVYLAAFCMGNVKIDAFPLLLERFYIHSYSFIPFFFESNFLGYLCLELESIKVFQTVPILVFLSYKLLKYKNFLY